MEFDKLMAEAGNKVYNFDILVGFLTISIAHSDQERLIKLMRCAVELGITDLDAVSHTFVVD